MTISYLIEQVERVTGPDREIDRGVQRLVAKLKHGDELWGIGADGSQPHYTSSVDAVIELIGRVLPEWGWRASIDESGQHASAVTHRSHPTNKECFSEHPQIVLALLLATLRAVQAVQAGEK